MQFTDEALKYLNLGITAEIAAYGFYKKAAVVLNDKELQEAVLKIAADTAFFGAPVERFLEDRRLQQDFFVSYYLDYEPERAWTAEAEGLVVGYLTGSVGDAQAARRA